MILGRHIATSPAADSPEDLERLALATARDYFGPETELELDQHYGASERWSNVNTGEHASPRYRGVSIRVYELVPDPRPGGWNQA
jgi:hypothetical protein